MSKLDEVLRSEAARHAPAVDDALFDRLVDRHRLRTRRRRRGTAILGMVVVIATVGVFFVASQTVSKDRDAVDRPSVTRIEERITFAVLARERVEVWSIAPDGSDARQISTPQGGVSPAQSPDGTSITFVSHEDRPGLWIARADGSDPVRVVPGTSIGEPAWSPDGSMIVFTRNEGGHAELYVVEVESGAVTQITENPRGQDYAPAWSPDGSAIAFGRNSGGPTDLWLVAPDGAGLTQLTHERVSYHDGGVSGPAWSPDGRTIVFEVAQNFEALNHPADLFSLGVSSGDVFRLTETSADESAPTFSPDGHRVAYMSGDEAQAIVIAQQDGSDPVIVRSDLAGMGSLSWGLLEIQGAPDEEAPGPPVVSPEPSIADPKAPPAVIPREALPVPDPSPWPINPGEKRDRPTSTNVAIGQERAFTLASHCGIDWRVDFAGSFWQSYGEGKIPVVSPFSERGTMTLLSGEVAVFRFRSRGEQVAIYFVRNDHPKPVVGCD